MSRAVVLLAVATILFNPPTASARTWQDSTGKFRVEAEFVDVKGDMVDDLIALIRVDHP